MSMYCIYWDLDISMTLRIWVDQIFCPDYSIHVNKSLLILNIMIYLNNLTDYTWYLLDNYIVHVTIVAGKILLYSNNTLMLYLLHVLLYRYPVHWHYNPVISVSWLHILMLLLIEVQPAQKIQNFRTFKTGVQGAQFYRNSKWLCGSWSTRRD